MWSWESQEVESLWSESSSLESVRAPPEVEQQKSFFKMPMKASLKSLFVIA